MICADELGPVIPRSFPPPPGWSADGHRVKAPLDYGRGPEKTWVYGALRPYSKGALTRWPSSVQPGGGGKVRGMTGPSSSAHTTVTPAGGVV